MALEEDRDIEQEVDRYRQRDLIPSHLYRLGKKLFGTEPTRHRVIDASRHVPRELVPHATNLRRTWDGRPLQKVSSPDPPLKRRYSEQNLNFVKTSDFTERDYKQWMDERKQTRNGLDSMAMSERWLCSKTRSSLENKLLAELREKRILAASQIQTTTSEEAVSTPSDNTVTSGQISRYKSLNRSRQSTLAVARTLSSHILQGRQRFVSLLTLHDPAGTGLITRELLESILFKMCPSISGDSMELIMRGLPVNDHGLVEYSTLLKGGLLQCVEEYFEIERSALALTPANSISEREELPCIDTSQTVCTMTGERGALSTTHKEKEEKQFEILVEFCKERGLVLNRQLLEKALLLPHDHSRTSCLTALRQPGLELQSQKLLIPPRERAKLVEREDYGKKFGWPYKELRGKKKPAVIRIPKPPKKSSQEDDSKPAPVKKAVLKKVAVEPKVDCWLTFKEYRWLTREITSRPGFNYKYHGLADNNAFWPGVLADKLRLWLPSETLQDKPYSLYNIFQPVTHPRIYNPHTPDMEQRRGWPENERGYVQFGGDNRKTYAL